MNRVYSVLQVNNYIKSMFRQDYVLSELQVQGEVSNCKYHRSGHIYFTLKDEGAAVNCVMFAGFRSGLAFSMKDGDMVVVSGFVDVYEKTGAYQLYVKKVKKAGTGELYERFLKLKEELEDMGCFAPEYKRRIPPFASKIGIVTAPGGAAVRDIISISRRRSPGISLYLYPALVQGEGAKESIVKGIETLDSFGLDVLIVGRGGGSIEDLWAFNEKCVVEAIFNCSTPVISAVGHETDTTLSDLAADLRAPTPSAAAELAVPDVTGLIEKLNSAETFMSGVIGRALSEKRAMCTAFAAKLAAASPENTLKLQREALAFRDKRIREAADRAMDEKRHRLKLYIGTLGGLSPLSRLGAGYSYTENSRGRAVKCIADAAPGEEVKINVTDGYLLAEIKTAEKAGK